MPKITGNNLEEHRARVRRSLFAALASLMAEHGYAEISMAELAARAGMGRTAIYNHFPDKETLLIEYVCEEMERFSTAFQQARNEENNPVTELQLFVYSQLVVDRSYLTAPGPPLQSTISRDAALRLRNQSLRVTALLTDIIKRGIAAKVFPAQDVALTCYLINGALSGRRIPQQQPARTNFFIAAQNFVLRAVGVENLPQPILRSTLDEYYPGAQASPAQSAS